MIKRATLCALLVAATLCLPVTANAQAAPCKYSAGAIVRLTGPLPSFRWMRNKTPLGVGIYKEVLGGDQLSVSGTGSSISVQDAAGAIQRIVPANGVVCFKAAARVSWITNAVAALGDLITRRLEGFGSLVARGGKTLALLPSDLKAGTATVIAGRRPLALAWRGGEPPFAVEIASERGLVLVKESSVDARLLRFAEPRNLIAGTYVVTLSDSAGARVTGTFTAVAGTLPATATPDEALAATGALYGRDPNRTFDAFLLLSPWYKVDEPASEAFNVMRFELP